MLFRKKEYTGGKSLSVYAWEKFRHNRLAFGALVFTLLVALMAVLGYLITPDQSPMANEQHLELAKQKPGFRVDMLRIKRNGTISSGGLFHRMVYGSQPDYSEIPISAWEVKDLALMVEEYTPYPVKHKKIITIPMGIRRKKALYKRSICLAQTSMAVTCSAGS